MNIFVVCICFFFIMSKVMLQISSVSYVSHVEYNSLLLPAHATVVCLHCNVYYHTLKLPSLGCVLF